MEIEEEEKGIPKALRNLIDKQVDVASLSIVTRKIHSKYGEGQLSDQLLKRCRAWVARKMDELTPGEKH